MVATGRGSWEEVGDHRSSVKSVRQRAVHILLRAWSGLCLIAVLILIFARWLRYEWTSPPALIDHALAEIMVIEQQTFLWSWVYSVLARRSLLLLLALPIVGFHRRLWGQLFYFDGVWRLTPGAIAVTLSGMLWGHYLFDLNPTVALICIASLVIAEFVRRGPVAPMWLQSALWGSLFAYALLLAGDTSDRIAVVGWAVFLLNAHWWLAARVAPRDLALLGMLAIIPANLAAAMLPVAIPVHGGTLLGSGLAYSFCEVPGRQILYAAIPECDSVQPGYDQCREGRLVAYDLRTMKPVATQRFFSPDFYGRLELLVCLPDEVQVAMQGTYYQGRSVVQSVLSFPVDDPARYKVLATDEGIGTTIAYDQIHDAFFYSGEFQNPVVRFDRRSGAFDDTVGQQFRRPWVEPVSLQAHNGSLALHTRSVHPGRNRLYLADWMQGRYAYALDLSALRLVARYDAGGGGAMGVAVDPERDRLYVSSMWGLEVFDLKTDQLIARKRTGLGNRPMIVDAIHNRLYLSSMVEGKIRIFDRDTLDLIGQIPIGLGSRYAELSLDQKYLFASSAAAHYYWDADALLPVR